MSNAETKKLTPQPKANSKITEGTRVFEDVISKIYANNKSVQMSIITKNENLCNVTKVIKRHQHK